MVLYNSFNNTVQLKKEYIRRVNINNLFELTKKLNNIIYLIKLDYFNTIIEKNKLIRNSTIIIISFIEGFLGETIKKKKMKFFLLIHK